MTEGGGIVCKAGTVNLWTDDWESDDDWSGGGARSKRCVPRGPSLGATVYELGPGNFAVYHFHHGSEELLLVLRGRPTMRTPEGEQQLEEGDVVHFPPGPDGAHGLRNDTGGPVRYVVAGIRVSPEVVEYPELGQVTSQSRFQSQRGEPLFLIHDLGEGASDAEP
jgi:uncharacterized cupin superfamily protein